MEKDARIAVMGASGLVGSAIIRALLARGYRRITGVYHQRKPSFSEIELCSCDLRREEEVERFFTTVKPEYLFLAASRVGGILANRMHKAEFFYDNILIATHVIHAAFRHGVKKLLNLGSSCIYPRQCPQPIKEEYLLTGPLEPTNEGYALAKIAAIKLCRYYNEQYNTRFLSAMPANLYGPHDNFDFLSSHVLAALLRKFLLARALREGDYPFIHADLRNRPVPEYTGKEDQRSLQALLEGYGITAAAVTIWGRGEVYREFLYVEDLAEACLFLMEEVEPEQTRAFSPDFFLNVGSGKDLKVIELARLIGEIVGFTGEIRHDLTKPEGTPRKLLDITRITSLGWQPQTSLEQGIRKTLHWYRTHLKEREGGTRREKSSR